MCCFCKLNFFFAGSAQKGVNLVKLLCCVYICKLTSNICNYILDTFLFQEGQGFQVPFDSGRIQDPQVGTLLQDQEYSAT
jgi:hypothetical protein